MLLAIDAGNTNIVFGLMEDEGVRYSWRMSTASHLSLDDIKARFEVAIIEGGLGDKKIKGAIIASVVPELTPELVGFCQQLGHQALVVGEMGVDLGIAVRTDNPEEVGADRLVNAVAAASLFSGKKTIIVDFGTATTFDVIDRDGAYLGGLICPGIGLSLRALHEATAKLPYVEFKETDRDRILGTNTRDAIQSGIYWGYVGLVEGILKRLQDEQGKCRVVATGGLAPAFSRNTLALEHVDGMLTLQGLRLIFEQNQHH
jgi:type III pantothenate kinase